MPITVWATTTDQEVDANMRVHHIARRVGVGSPLTPRVGRVLEPARDACCSDRCTVSISVRDRTRQDARMNQPTRHRIALQYDRFSSAGFEKRKPICRFELSFIRFLHICEIRKWLAGHTHSRISSYVGIITHQLFRTSAMGTAWIAHGSIICRAFISTYKHLWAYYSSYPRRARAGSQFSTGRR